MDNKTVSIQSVLVNSPMNFSAARKATKKEGKHYPGAKLGLDTNVLVRYLVQDEPHQARLATRLIESCNADNPGHVCLPVLMELVWVLGGAYGYARRDIAEVLQELLTVAELRIEQPDQARQALDAYAAGAADFADYFLVCSTLLKAARRPIRFTNELPSRAGTRCWHRNLKGGSLARFHFHRQLLA